MVFADRRCGFVQEVFAGIRNAGVNLLDVDFRPLPIAAVLDLAVQAPLVAGKALLMFLETAQRREERPITHRGESGNVGIDADRRCRHRRGLLELAPSLHRHEPLAAGLGESGSTHCALDVSAVSVTQPAKLGQINTTVGLIEFDLFRFGIAETVATAFFLKPREAGPFGEEVLAGFFQVFQGMLQCL